MVGEVVDCKVYDVLIGFFECVFDVLFVDKGYDVDVICIDFVGWNIEVVIFGWLNCCVIIDYDWVFY